MSAVWWWLALSPPPPPTAAILLKHLKLPASVIKEAVLSCDHSVLGEQHIRLMAAFAPDKREVSTTDEHHHLTFSYISMQCLGLARYYDNPSVLSLPDQFSCEVISQSLFHTIPSPFHTVVLPFQMSTIPCYVERLQAMLFRMHYQEKVDEMRPVML